MMIDAVITPPTRDLGGGFKVQRALPSVQRRSVGPFVFVDHFGPTLLRAGTGLDVRPHPHIGLATVTYLFDGEVMHRDSLGSVQLIRPGEVNWMIAGRGIVHSERTAPERRLADSNLYGMQIWVALPRAQEETAPSFQHYPAAALPSIEADGTALRLIAGSLFGERSPVATLSDMFYAEVKLTSGAALPLSTEHEQRAIYILAGRVELDGQLFEPGQLIVLRAGLPVALRAAAPAHILLLGGAPLDGERHVWWNFVSSSKERIDQAKADWLESRFGSVPGDDEFIPLPET
jgi:redox-sensitive bicupin YhaK (pirin superfamily)